MNEIIVPWGPNYAIMHSLGPDTIPKAQMSSDDIWAHSLLVVAVVGGQTWMVVVKRLLWLLNLDRKKKHISYSKQTKKEEKKTLAPDRVPRPRQHLMSSGSIIKPR